MSPVLQPSTLLSNKEIQKTDVHVGIIGAGLAGLRAARHFEENGVRYTILEGSGRIGGRVYPFEYEDGFLHHGAEYVNGLDNEICDIVQKRGLGVERVSDLYMLDDNAVTVIDGKIVDREIISSWNIFVESLESILYQEAETCKKGQAAIPRLDAHFQSFLERPEIAKANYDIFLMLKKLYYNFFQIEWASIKELSLENWTRWDAGTEEEDSMVLNKFGFQKILEEFKNGISMKNVMLNSKVININYGGEKVRIRLEDGADLHFDHVIVTSSLGYLKRHSGKMFSPQLPTEKQEAIEGMGFGSTMKVLLEYDKAWWPENVSTIQVAASSNYAETSKLTDNLMVFQPSSWAPNILVAWLADQGPIEVAILNDRELLDTINNYLEHQLGGEFSVGRAKRVFRHSWIDDEFALGSYSYLKSTSDTYQNEILEELAKPFTINEKPLLCFAGEHTSSKMYQTTVGAAESGLREAERILNFYLN